MVGKHRNSSMKRMNKEVETLQDELKDIYNLIHRVVELIAKEPEVHEVGQILFDLWDIFKKNKEHKMLDSLTSVKKGHKVLKCNLCEMTFDRFSDLETHLITSHEAPRAFHCNQCEKTFVTKWRLRKHTQVHSNKVKKHCIYFKHNVKCPFDDLGCKFLHVTSDIYRFENEHSDDEQKNETESDFDLDIEGITNLSEKIHQTQEFDSDMKVNNTTSDISKITSETRSVVMSRSVKTEDSLETLKFCTSTPKKLGHTKFYETKEKVKCENCTDQSQCDGCYVDEYIRKQRKYNGSYCFFNK